MPYEVSDGDAHALLLVGFGGEDAVRQVLDGEVAVGGDRNETHGELKGLEECVCVVGVFFENELVLEVGESLFYVRFVWQVQAV